MPDQIDLNSGGRPPRPWLASIILGLGGVASGFATRFVPVPFDDLELDFPGDGRIPGLLIHLNEPVVPISAPVFFAALLVYPLARWTGASLLRVAAMIPISLFAWLLAVNLAYFIAGPTVIPDTALESALGAELVAGLVAGCAGGLALSVGLMVISKRFRSLLFMMVTTMAATFLGAFLDMRLAISEETWALSLYLFWQAGVAACIGFFAARKAATVRHLS